MYLPIWLVVALSLMAISTCPMVLVIGHMLDQGHRCYVVVNTNVIKVLAPILEKECGMVEVLSADTPPVRQTMMRIGMRAEVVFMTTLDKSIILDDVQPSTMLAVMARNSGGVIKTVTSLLFEKRYFPCALSVLSSNPIAAAKATVKALVDAGFDDAQMLDGFLPDQYGQITLVSCCAFSGWILVFRRHMIFMDLPANPHLITKPETFFSLLTVIRTDMRIRKWLKNQHIST